MNEEQDRDSRHLVLGSASPRRRHLLEGLGLRFQVVPSAITEDHVEGESPDRHVTRLAMRKATDVATCRSEGWVLAADTIVVIDEQILGKPHDEEEAAHMLSLLAGRTHTVYTGYALLNRATPGTGRLRWVASEVDIRDLSAEEIQGYIRTGEPMDKAGSYAIQGIGAAIVERVSGSYTNVVGLPLCEVSRDLKELGIFDFLDRRSNP
jgi:septum formation protein